MAVVVTNDCLFSEWPSAAGLPANGRWSRAESSATRRTLPTPACAPAGGGIAAQHVPGVESVDEFHSGDTGRVQHGRRATGDVPVARFQPHAGRLLRSFRRPLLRRLGAVLNARAGAAAVARPDRHRRRRPAHLHHANEPDSKAAHSHSAGLRARNATRQSVPDGRSARLSGAGVEPLARSASSAGAHLVGRDAADAGPPVFPAFDDAGPADERRPAAEHVAVPDVVLDAVVAGRDGRVARSAEDGAVRSAVPPGALGVQPRGAVFRGVVRAGGQFDDDVVIQDARNDVQLVETWQPGVEQLGAARQFAAAGISTIVVFVIVHPNWDVDVDYEEVTRSTPTDGSVHFSQPR